MAGNLEGLDRLEGLVDGTLELDPESAVLKSVNDLTDYSVRRTLLALLKQLKTEVEDEKFTAEGNRFLLMAIASNVIQLRS